jgi:hypothetical protein
MSTVKAKFNCIGVEDFADQKQKRVTFGPVIDGSEENKSFAKYTPSGGLYLWISYDTPASDAFEAGKSYYLTLEEAPEV